MSSRLSYTHSRGHGVWMICCGDFPGCEFPSNPPRRVWLIGSETTHNRNGEGFFSLLRDGKHQEGFRHGDAGVTPSHPVGHAQRRPSLSRTASRSGQFNPSMVTLYFLGNRKEGHPVASLSGKRPLANAQRVAGATTWQREPNGKDMRTTSNPRRANRSTRKKAIRGLPASSHRTGH